MNDLSLGQSLQCCLSLIQQPLPLQLLSFSAVECSSSIGLDKVYISQPHHFQQQVGWETRLGHHLTSKNAQPTRESATGGAAHQHGRQVADCEKVHQTALVPQQEGVTSAPRVSHAARAYPYSPGTPRTLIQGAGLAGGPCQRGHNGKDRVWWRHIVNEEGGLLCVSPAYESVCA